MSSPHPRRPREHLPQSRAPSAARATPAALTACESAARDRARLTVRLGVVATIRLGLAQLNVTRRRTRRQRRARCWRALRRRRGPGLRPGRHPRARPRRATRPRTCLLKEGFVEDAVAALEKLAAASPTCLGRRRHRRARRTRGSSPLRRPVDARDVAGAAARVAAPPSRERRGARRRRTAARGGRAKRRLPNYEVFDEQRWFLPGDGPHVVIDVAVASARRRRRSARTSGSTTARPPSSLAQGAALLVVLNASPYSRGRGARAPRGAAAPRAPRRAAPIAYVNLVGGQDELVFDGESLVCSPTATVARRRAAVRARTCSSCDIDVARPRRRTACFPGCSERPATTAARRRARHASPSRCATVEEVYEALVHRHARLPAQERVLARRWSRCRAASTRRWSPPIAVDAARARARCSASRCRRGTARRTRVDDARELAERLGIRCRHRPDRARARRALAPSSTDVLGGEPAGLTDENLQSRIRGVLLMAISNATGAHRAHDREQVRARHGLLDALRRLRRGLRGHQGRGQDPGLRAVPLPQRRARRRTGRRPSRSPTRCSTSRRRPSCAPTSATTDSLPPYDVLDPVLEAYVEEDRTADELVAAGYDPALVRARRRARRRRGVQAPPDGAGGAHHLEGVRQATGACPITNRYGRPRPS